MWQSSDAQGATIDDRLAGTEKELRQSIDVQGKPINDRSAGIEKTLSDIRPSPDNFGIPNDIWVNLPIQLAQVRGG